MPMLVVLLMGLLEVALALNASLAVNRASQHGAHVAASAGNLAGADCLILEAIEGDLGVPNDVANISEVLIERTAMAGNVVYGTQKWVRGGNTTCTYPDGTEVEVPYTLASDGYPETQRCSVLGGCPTLTPARSTVDNVGVSVRYRHDWVTPLNGAIGMHTPGGTGSDSEVLAHRPDRNVSGPRSVSVAGSNTSSPSSRQSRSSARSDVSAAFAPPISTLIPCSTSGA